MSDLIIYGAIAAVVILIFLTYMGVFMSVKLSRESLEPFKFIARQYVGPYHKIGSFAEKLHIEAGRRKNNTTSFGLYYDNPEEVPQEDCRALMGLNISDNESKNDVELLSKFLVEEFPHTEVLSFHFPYRNMFSFMIGVMKFYPYLKKQNITNAPCMIEIYRPNEIIFAVPLDSSDSSVSSESLFLPFERSD